MSKVLEHSSTDERGALFLWLSETVKLVRSQYPGPAPVRDVHWGKRLSLSVEDTEPNWAVVPRLPYHVGWRYVRKSSELTRDYA